MVGRRMIGASAYKFAEALGAAPEEYGGRRNVSFGGRDVIFAGDERQIPPIGDDPLYVEGPYSGKGKFAEAPAIPTETLSNSGAAILQEFEDVVILREVHRLDDGHDRMTAPERAKYRDEADRFLQVTAGMANCEWTSVDHQWLSSRNQSKLMATEAGRAEIKKFENAPLLMDGRKKDVFGRDGADKLNVEFLEQLSSSTGNPIAEISALHDFPAKMKRVDHWSPDDFRGLVATLELCEGARVLLTQNIWVEAGLMNGALGVVKGFMWPEGGDPGSSESRLSSPLCVLVEFDEVELGTDSKGNDRSFFPDHDEKKKWIPIFRQKVSAMSKDKVAREQFPLVLAWAFTHWKAQGMTLRRVRIRLGARGAGSQGVGFVACTRVGHSRRLLFEADLPQREILQAIQHTTEFRRRLRFTLRMIACASVTLRK